MIRAEGAACHGMAYRITPEVLAPLDVREKNGYLREKVTLTFWMPQATPMPNSPRPTG